MMNLVIPRENVLANLCKQIDTFFSINADEKDLIAENIDEALFKCELCFAQTSNKYFKANGSLGGVKFNPFHSVQYMTFLYWLAHILYINKKGGLLCDKLYYLNKTMNGLDMFYAIEMPDSFSAEHPVGTVLGRAKYGNGFFFYQGCTVGGNYDKEGVLHYPVIGENVKMFANSSLIGKCKIGNNVILGAGALVKNEDIPDNTIVFGQSPNLVLKHRNK